MRLTRIAIAAAALAALLPARARAQDTAPHLSVGYERTRDRFHYRFENPSNFDTAELVPHEFTQTYWADNHWIVLRARYRVRGRALETEAAATPQRSTRGDDYDTFFQPSGDIVVVGTTGGVSLRSWRVRQSIDAGRRAGLDWQIAYRYQRDRSVFHAGVKSISHTQPGSFEAFLIDTRETTASHTYGGEIRVSRSWRPARWRVTAFASAAPIANGRLSILLPDKYPGQTLAFNAIYAEIRPGISAAMGSRLPISITAGYGRTFSYAGSRQFGRSALTVGAGLGIPKL